MNEQSKGIVIGYDLGNITSQISYCLLEQDEPETISTVAGMEQFNIPTVLCKRREVNQWFYGKEAETLAENGEGELIQDILKAVQEETPIVVENVTYEPKDLLTLFVKRSLAILSMVCIGNRINKFVITVNELTHTLLTVLQEIAKDIPYKVDEVCFLSREESFFSFMIHQKKELWNQQVVVCDTSEGYLTTYRLEMNRRTIPVVAFIEKREYPDMDFTRMPKTEMALANFYATYDEELLEIVKGSMRERGVSSVYLIGDAFAGEWCKKTLHYVCLGRKVFQGNNMYSKGAAYHAKERVNTTEVGKGHIFLGNDKLKANIGMKLVKSGVEAYYAILDAGQNWYDSKKSFDAILESNNEISFSITPLNGRDIKVIEISLDGLPNRPPKATRLCIKVELVAENQLRIQIIDKGFGEMYPSSGKEWIEEIEIV